MNNSPTFNVLSFFKNIFKTMLVYDITFQRKNEKPLTFENNFRMRQNHILTSPEDG